MATFSIYQDKRNTKHKEKHPLAVRILYKKSVVYLHLPGIEWTEADYTRIFKRKQYNAETEQIRKSLDKYVERAKQIFTLVDPFDPKEIRRLFYDRTFDPSRSYKTKTGAPEELEILYETAIKHKLNTNLISPHTAEVYRYNCRRFLAFHPDLCIQDVTPSFLANFERWYLSQKNGKNETNSLASVGSVMRSLRAVIKHHIKKKTIPSTYEYPFNEYSIPSHNPAKQVISNSEIQQIVDMTEFDNKDQEYARDIWLLLYRMNGINFVDLLKLRWTDIKGKYLIFRRHKTLRTRRHNIRDIKVFISPKIQSLLDKHCVKSSTFIMGLINKEDYDETYLMNRNKKLKGKINSHLKQIGAKLGLSLPLDISMARDAYANTMKRAGKSVELIAEQMNHASTMTTQRHYLDSFDDETLDTANDVIL